jgi:hypothetical protein
MARGGGEFEIGLREASKGMERRKQQRCEGKEEKGDTRPPLPLELDLRRRASR